MEISPFRQNLHTFVRMENRAKRANVRCAPWMLRAVFSISDLGPRRLSVRSMSVSSLLQQAVMRPTVQQHYKGSTSTPPRVARLCQIREASLVALRKFPKIYACSHVSIVRLVQSTILVSRDFHSHSSPLYHLASQLVSFSSVPVPSIDLNL